MGIRWASCNIGATTPEDYGNYYAWGETETKDSYLWETYKYANGAEDKLTKYCSNAYYGNNDFTDTLTTLEPEDDAATASWGSVWRMPTAAEMDELLENCTWTWTTKNDVKGYQVTSNTNGNSIFLPAAGYYFKATLNGNNSSCCYLSASLYEKNPTRAWYIYNKYAGTKMNRDYCYRYYGQSVRPVQDKQEEVVEPAYVPKPFTVAEGKQITFSGGNLQYTQSTQTWAFAEHQYDMLGEANITTGADGNKALADKIDLFGWSGSTATAKWGIGTSTSTSDYSGDFVDWGTNTIGTDAPDTWRTLTNDEWYYLRYTRTNADNLVGVARINLNADGSKYVNGLVLLPDNWTCPAGVTFKSGFAGTSSVQAYADYQTFTLSDWQQLEAAGAVFLPASGYRYGSNVYYVQYGGYYWSATPPSDSDDALYLYFLSNEAGTYNTNRNDGQSVRLVKDEQEEVVEPAYVPKPFTVAQGKQITFSGGNLQYTQSTQTWAFAVHQYDMLGTDNVDGNKSYDAIYGYDKTGSALADKIDLFCWSGSTGSAKWGISTSKDNSDYSGDFADWGTNIDDGNTWYTLTADEWDYLLNERPDAAQLKGVARIQFGENKYTNGLVLLPDDWACPAGVTFKLGFSNTYSVQAYADYQTFTSSDWQQLEAAGAVFLPASGFRDGAYVGYVQNSGYYWSAAHSKSDCAYVFLFGTDGADTDNYSRYYGQSVRLVKNYSNVSTDAANPSTTNTEVRKLLRNGQVLIERGGKTYTTTGVEVK